MKDKETKVTDTPKKDNKDNHEPRPVTPEDESYGELMMRFTAHPVKPKYWFEEFGDHWTCSCGQVNKGDSCANCGLERDLLRKLFILHKPSADGTPAGKSPESSGAGMASGLPRSVQPFDPGQKQNASDSASGEGPKEKHTGLIVGIVIVFLLLLMGAGAGAYFVLLPEMQEQDAAKRDSVRISLSENLPVATAQVPRAQYKAYVAAGNKLCKMEKYRKAIGYYKKAANLKNDDSIKQKILDAKFGYVKTHQSDGSGHFETYLNELIEANYNGAQTIYDSYYAWHVSIVANNIKDDSSTDMQNLNKADTIYFHTTLSGGPPNGTIQFYYQVIWPDDTAEKKDIESTYQAGSTFSTRFQYAMPIFAKSGKLTFELYDKESHDLMGKDTVNLRN